MRSMKPMSSPAEIIDLWFPDDRERANKMWWGKDPALDAIRPTLAHECGRVLARIHGIDPGTTTSSTVKVNFCLGLSELATRAWPMRSM